MKKKTKTKFYVIKASFCWLWKCELKCFYIHTWNKNKKQKQIWKLNEQNNKNKNMCKILLKEYFIEKQKKKNVFTYLIDAPKLKTENLDKFSNNKTLKWICINCFWPYFFSEMSQMILNIRAYKIFIFCKLFIAKNSLVQ